MNRGNMSILLLQIGLSFVFIYAAFSSFLNPTSWIGFFPMFLRDIVPEAVLLNGFSIVEIVLAVLLFVPRTVFYASIAASVLFLGMIVFNIGSLDIVFRDVGLAFAALALAAAVNRPLTFNH